MSFRRRKREIEQLANKRLEKIEYKKRALNRSAGKDLFETVDIKKKFGPINYSKSGLKIAPVIAVTLWFFSLAFRYVRMSVLENARLESMILQIWRLRMSVINWTIRKKVAPKGSIGDYLVTVTFPKP